MHLRPSRFFDCLPFSCVLGAPQPVSKSEGQDLSSLKHNQRTGCLRKPQPSSHLALFLPREPPRSRLPHRNQVLPLVVPQRLPLVVPQRLVLVASAAVRECRNQAPSAVLQRQKMMSGVLAEAQRNQAPSAVLQRQKMRNGVLAEAQTQTFAPHGHGDPSCDSTGPRSCVSQTLHVIQLDHEGVFSHGFQQRVGASSRLPGGRGF
jgi:hypothetical protein